jgi:hypothetical protein
MKNLIARLRYVSLLPLILLAWMATAYAQITPLGDSFTNTADPNTNYGTQTLLYVDGAQTITYVQFDLASIPTTASISQATLKLYVNSVTRRAVLMSITSTGRGRKARSMPTMHPGWERRLPRAWPSPQQTRTNTSSSTSPRQYRRGSAEARPTTASRWWPTARSTRRSTVRRALRPATRPSWISRLPEAMEPSPA